MVLEQIILASFVVSLVSFVGVLTLVMKDKLLHSLLFVFVSFAAGSMIAAAFFDLMPESINASGIENTMALAVAGIVLFFIIEKFFFWHHHHKHHHEGDTNEKPFTYLNLIGDGVHNFIDGTVIAASFMASPATGIVSTFAIIAHEIPQEIGDFSLMIYGGFSYRKALLFNFITALTALIGAIATFFLLPLIPGLTNMLLPIAAGNFIYVACVDLVPELRKEIDGKKSVAQLAAFLGGIIVIVATGKLIGE